MKFVRILRKDPLGTSGHRHLALARRDVTAVVAEAFQLYDVVQYRVHKPFGPLPIVVMTSQHSRAAAT